MARRRTIAAVAADPAETRLDHGVRIVCDPGDGRPGDLIEAYVGDDLIGAARLQPSAADGALAALIDIGNAPLLSFPARLRVMNARSLIEVGAGVPLADATALRALAGPPGVVARFAGLDAAGVAFGVTIDRLAHYPRPFRLRLGTDVQIAAMSAPDEAGVHRLVFPLQAPVAPDTAFEVIETQFDVVALAGRFDAAQVAAGAMAQLARLTAEMAALREDHAALRRRLEVALDLGRAGLLLDRLDLFYLLLCERIDRATAAPRPPAPPSSLAETRWFGPAEVDGIGIFDVETDGRNEWRWFGPEVTIALRGIAFRARRVVLYFHGFGNAPEPPVVRVSLGGPAEPARLRSLEGRYALDIPVARATAALEGMLIVHLSFDRHQTSAADPRLLSAVFSGAEVIAEAG